jgi:hypothetical protein
MKMKFLHALVVAGLSLGLSGCVMSEQRFTEVRTVLKKRPDIRAKMMAECIKDMNRDSAEEREVFGALLDMKTSTLPQTFCRRIEQSFLSGRLTYQDYKDASKGKPTARLIRIMRGK